jgi:adenylosuccinate synthase
MGDLLQPGWLETRLDNALRTINRKIEILGGEPVNGAELFALCMDYRAKLADRIIDTVPMTRHAVENGHDILLEGQLGVMRDLDWGIYPYVTSSNPTAAFASSGAGLPARTIDRVIGVVKAYSTAVGDGPFPAELHDADGEKLRTVGGEFGATTGRPRRCGWFDGVAIGYAAWLNGMTGLAITKLDILDHFETLQIVTGYRLPNGTVITDSMPDTPVLNQVTPITEEWPGWLTSTEDCRTWDDLPKAARQYIHRLAELAGVKVDYVSVGPERAQMFAV